VANFTEALGAIARAQEDEAAIIEQQQEAARARGISLQRLAEAFRKAAVLANDTPTRKRFELYAQQSDREADAAFHQQRIHAAEASRARVQAETTRERGATATVRATSRRQGRR
jgi:hypothetical protein